jgi:hypothetical protein
MRGARSARGATTSRLLVVDASVARAAGGEDATDPVPAHARDVLKAILVICHRICLTPALQEEWKRHQSRFARRWLTQMYAARKVVICEPPPCRDVLADIRSDRSITRSDVAAAEKDMHLIEAAVVMGRTVLSWDNKVAAVIRKVCGGGAATRRLIGDVLWINPIAERDALHAWLSGVGSARPYWQLGFSTTPTVTGPRTRTRSTRRGKR